MSNVTSVVNHFSTANEGFSTTISSTVASGASTIPLSSTSGLTNGSIFVGIIEPGEEKQQVFTGTVDTGGNQITGVTWTRGTNVEHLNGVTVVDYVSGTAHNMMTKGILVEHNQDGTHSDITADSLEVTGAAVLGGTEGRLGDVVTFTGSGTWTKDANLKFVIVEVQGGGGGGGGSSNTDNRIGGGGGGGGFSRKKIAVGDLGATETVTIGAAGAAGTSTGNGGNGGNSSFGAHAVGNGGTGGTAGSASTATGSAAGGTATSGDLNISGQPGANGGDRDAATDGAGARTGQGGGSILGRGAWPAGTAGPGTAASGYGGGGSGGSTAAGAAEAGGAGTIGIIIVYEYY